MPLRSRIFAAVLTLAAAFVGNCSFANEPQTTPQGGKFVSQPTRFTTLVNPECSHCVDEARRRAADLREDDRVLAWIRGKYDGGGIPYRFFLAPYRVISDTYGVFVFDADAGYVRGYEPSLDFTFHGWRNGVLVIKHKDGTLFSALSGIAFDGPRKGERLKPVATLETDWGHWSAAYPGSVAYHMFDKYQPIALPSRLESASASTRAPVDPRLNRDEEVIGVEIDGAARAYRLADLEAAGGIVADKLGDRDVYVLWYALTRTAAVYENGLDDSNPRRMVSLSFDAQKPQTPFVDVSTSSSFGIEGRAVDGELKGQTLTWLPGVQCRWFAWSVEFPHTDVYEPKVTAQAARGAKAAQGVLISASQATPEQIASWQSGGVKLAALVLDDDTPAAEYAAAAKNLAAAGLAIDYWIEVGRNPRLADEHPEWMAALGVHEDWQVRFPNTPLPGKEQAAKAYPWVPIGYRDAYAAQLERVERLLTKAAGDYRHLLLNDLQGGPASCGCGNLQCRWALDYHVPSTTTRLDGSDAAARFVNDVERLAPGKSVVPVWTTECEDLDLPPESKKLAGKKSTGLCGSVHCATGLCPKEFAKQWTALVAACDGPIGVLATHAEFERGESSRAAEWIEQALAYLEQTPASEGAPTISRDRLWIFVEGYGASESETAGLNDAAVTSGASTAISALVRIEQSYEPRIVSAGQ